MKTLNIFLQIQRWTHNHKGSFFPLFWWNGSVVTLLHPVFHIQSYPVNIWSWRSTSFSKSKGGLATTGALPFFSPWRWLSRRRAMAETVEWMNKSFTLSWIPNASSTRFKSRVANRECLEVNTLWVCLWTPLRKKKELRRARWKKAEAQFGERS